MRNIVSPSCSRWNGEYDRDLMGETVGSFLYQDGAPGHDTYGIASHALVRLWQGDTFAGLVFHGPAGRSKSRAAMCLAGSLHNRGARVSYLDLHRSDDLEAVLHIKGNNTSGELCRNLQGFEEDGLLDTQFIVLDHVTDSTVSVVDKAVSEVYDEGGLVVVTTDTIPFGNVLQFLPGVMLVDFGDSHGSEAVINPGFIPEATSIEGIFS